MRWLQRAIAALLWMAAHAPQAQSQLSSQDANFNGSIPSSCSINFPSNSYTMTYDSTYNKFWRTADFEVNSNGSIKLQLAKVEVVQEPSGIPNRTAYARLEYPSSPGSSSTSYHNLQHSSTASHDAAGEAITANNTPNTATEYTLIFNLETAQTDQNGRRYLLPGNYTYSVTINCLQ